MYIKSENNGEIDEWITNYITGYKQEVADELNELHARQRRANV